MPSSNESSRANSPDTSPLTANKNSVDPLKTTTTTQINNDIDLLHQDTSSKDVKLVSDD